MLTFDEDRQRIAAQLEEARQQEAQLTAERIRVRARIASLEAEDRFYAGQSNSAPPSDSAQPSDSAPAVDNLSHLTADKAIVTVLREAKPDLVRLQELDQTLRDRGKIVQGGCSVSLTSLKDRGFVNNPSWGYWTTTEKGDAELP
jgi:hypothetical protein